MLGVSHLFHHAFRGVRIAYFAVQEGLLFDFATAVSLYHSREFASQRKAICNRFYNGIKKEGAIHIIQAGSATAVNGMPTSLTGLSNLTMTITHRIVDQKRLVDVVQASFDQSLNWDGTISYTMSQKSSRTEVYEEVRAEPDGEPSTGAAVASDQADSAPPVYTIDELYHHYVDDRTASCGCVVTEYQTWSFKRGERSEELLWQMGDNFTIYLLDKRDGDDARTIQTCEFTKSLQDESPLFTLNNRTQQTVPIYIANDRHYSDFADLGEVPVALVAQDKEVRWVTDDELLHMDFAPSCERGYLVEMMARINVVLKPLEAGEYKLVVDNPTAHRVFVIRASFDEDWAPKLSRLLDAVEEQKYPTHDYQKYKMRLRIKLYDGESDYDDVGQLPSVVELNFLRGFNAEGKFALGCHAKIENEAHIDPEALAQQLRQIKKVFG